jgi:hypothetical protein
MSLKRFNTERLCPVADINHTTHVKPRVPVVLVLLWVFANVLEFLLACHFTFLL